MTDDIKPFSLYSIVKLQYIVLFQQRKTDDSELRLEVIRLNNRINRNIFVNTPINVFLVMV